MIDFLEKVEEFHNTFELPVLSEPVIPSKERCNLRLSLIKEELSELEHAINENNLVEAFDALNDLLYVLGGTVLEFGMKDKFKEGFDEVHRSNMSKSCSSIEEALNTVDYYKDKDGVSSSIFGEENKLIVKRSDGKILKSINYSPADLKKIILK